jgi:hypothetical protein
MKAYYIIVYGHSKTRTSPIIDVWSTAMTETEDKPAVRRESEGVGPQEGYLTTAVSSQVWTILTP